MENNKANLFIVGAMKAGTTSFSNAIAQHPGIYLSPIKEPNFFINELPKKIYTPSKYFSLKKYFERDFPNPLHIAHIESESQYNTLFSATKANYKYFADGSTSYLHAPETAEKIYKYNPGSKIIILLRNGLKRAFSHYKMDVGHGRTTKSFEAVLKEDWVAYQKGVLNNWSCLGMSLYAENVCRYKFFFKENVLIILLEDLIRNEEEVMKNVYSFLELDYAPIKLTRLNESFSIRFAKPLSWLYKIGVKDLFSYMLPVRIRHAAFNLLKRQSSSGEEISAEFKNELLSLFQRDIDKMKAECWI
jgi:hypothetical protein